MWKIPDQSIYKGHKRIKRKSIKYNLVELESQKMTISPEYFPLCYWSFIREIVLQ